MRGDDPYNYPYPVDKDFTPACESGECGRCRDCYREYVEAKLAGELEDVGQPA